MRTNYNFLYYIIATLTSGRLLLEQCIFITLYTFPCKWMPLIDLNIRRERLTPCISSLIQTDIPIGHPWATRATHICVGLPILNLVL